MKKIIFVFCLLLTGCTKTTQPTIVEVNNERIEVKKIGVIEDTLAYGNRRGIYIVTDKKTGAEFIGISGIGISEVNSHRAGKSRLEDER